MKSIKSTSSRANKGSLSKPKPKKKRIWLYVDEDILKWVYEKMRDKIYSDESHCFERLVMEKKAQDDAKLKGGK